MVIHVSDAPRRAARPIAAWILGIVGAAHGAVAFVFVTGARTPANEIEGFTMGTTAAVLLVGAVLSYGLVRVRAELRNLAPPR
jgi:L-aminopeptidase/D-esterase-like protein